MGLGLRAAAGAAVTALGTAGQCCAAGGVAPPGVAWAAVAEAADRADERDTIPPRWRRIAAEVVAAIPGRVEEARAMGAPMLALLTWDARDLITAAAADCVAEALGGAGAPRREVLREGRATSLIVDVGDLIAAARQRGSAAGVTRGDAAEGALRVILGIVEPADGGSVDMDATFSAAIARLCRAALGLEATS